MSEFDYDDMDHLPLERQMFMRAHRRVELMDQYRAKLLEPTNDLLHLLNGELESAREALDGCPQFYGFCHDCSVPIFEGDKGHGSPYDDYIVCATCAPTNADMIKYFEGILADGDLPEWAATRQEAIDHVEGLKTRKPEEKVVYIL